MGERERNMKKYKQKAAAKADMLAKIKWVLSGKFMVLSVDVFLFNKNSSDLMCSDVGEF